jgi:hypothetical protein
MTAPKLLVMITVGVLLVAALSACDREITRVEQVAQPADCFNCHSDQNTFLVAAERQYENSVHASGAHVGRAESSSCSGCHSSNGFLDRVNGDSPQGYDNPTAIHCFTCHAPHTDRNFMLRITEPQELQNGDSFDAGAANICIACHQSRRNVDTYVSGEVELSGHWGPHHGPQGDMFLASNGYEYEDYEYEIRPMHRGATEDGCLDCHFESTENYVLGGHSFNMEAMLGGEEVLNVAACDRCHGELADFDYEDTQTDVDALSEQLLGLLVDAGLMVDSEEGFEPPEDVTVSADSAGAVWNYLLVTEDRSHGVHNADYAKQLLESAIQYLEGGVAQEGSPALAADKPRTRVVGLSD